jgi:hypothetical protein
VKYADDTRSTPLTHMWFNLLKCFFFFFCHSILPFYWFTYSIFVLLLSYLRKCS